MAFSNGSLGYRYISVKKNERFKFLDVHRSSNFFYGRVQSTTMIDRMIEDSLNSMRPVGFNPLVGEAVVCQNFNGERVDHKWYRAQIVSKWDDMYRVIFVDYGNAAEYHKDVFCRHALYPTIELIQKPITCIPFKDKNNYSGVGMKVILSDFMKKCKRQWRFKAGHNYKEKVFNHQKAFQGKIFIRIGRRKVP